MSSWISIPPMVIFDRPLPWWIYIPAMIIITVCICWHNEYKNMTKKDADIQQHLSDNNELRTKLKHTEQQLLQAEAQVQELRQMLDEATQTADDTLHVFNDYISSKKTYVQSEAENYYHHALIGAYELAKKADQLPQFYAQHSLRELSQMPDDTVIGLDTLPRLRSEPGWGSKYSRYVSGYSGKCYHRESCQHAVMPQHVYRLRGLTPCQICCPELLPDMTWYNQYLVFRRECLKLSISPKPNDPQTHYVIPADVAQTPSVKYSLKPESDSDILAF